MSYLNGAWGDASPHAQSVPTHGAEGHLVDPRTCGKRRWVTSAAAGSELRSTGPSTVWPSPAGSSRFGCPSIIRVGRWSIWAKRWPTKVQCGNDAFLRALVVGPVEDEIFERVEDEMPGHDLLERPTQCEWLPRIRSAPAAERSGRRSAERVSGSAWQAGSAWQGGSAWQAGSAPPRGRPRIRPNPGRVTRRRKCRRTRRPRPASRPAARVTTCDEAGEGGWARPMTSTAGWGPQRI